MSSKNHKLAHRIKTQGEDKPNYVSPQSLPAKSGKRKWRPTAFLATIFRKKQKGLVATDLPVTNGFGGAQVGKVILMEQAPDGTITGTLEVDADFFREAVLPMPGWKRRETFIGRIDT